jgi:chaperonin GroEL (HSP60 family)
LIQPSKSKKTEISAEIRLRDPTQMKAFLDQENDNDAGNADKIKKSGARRRWFCQKGIDDMVLHFSQSEVSCGTPRE